MTVHGDPFLCGVAALRHGAKVLVRIIRANRELSASAYVSAHLGFKFTSEELTYLFSLYYFD